MAALSVEQLNAIRTEHNNLQHKHSTIFQLGDPLVKRYAEAFSKQLITKKKMDVD